MKAVIILLAIFLLLFLIGQIRVGGRVEYSQEGLKAWLRIHGLPVLLYPRPKKARGPEDEAKAEKKRRRREEKAARKRAKKAKKGEAEPETREQPRKKGGGVQLVLRLLPVGVEALGALKKRIRIDRLTLHYTAGGDDAAKTALTYGKLSGAAGMIVALLDNSFQVKQQEITMDVDFLAEKATVYLDVGLSIKIGQILYLGLRYGAASLKVFMKHRKGQKAPQAPNQTEENHENK